MWFWYGLLTAVLSSFSVVLNKKALNNVSAVLVSWSLFVLPLPILFVWMMKEGIPQLNGMFYFGVISSSLVFAFSKTLSLRSLKNNFLSRIFPLTVFGTFFSYLFALIFLGEQISAVPLIGLFCILVGAYVLNADKAREDVWMPLKLLFTHRESSIFLIAMILTSLTGIFDKIGIMNSRPNSPLFVLFTEDLLMSVLLTIYMLKTEPGWIGEFKRHKGVLILGSLVYTLVSLYFLIGITDGAVALVGGIKKLEILFVFLLSWIFFGDKPTKHAWFGTAIMLAGVILIKFT